MPSFKINFDTPRNFKNSEFQFLTNVIGLYFIFLDNMAIQYPFKNSRLIYIGMSEKRTNSIGSRLASHKSRQSGNHGLYNYAQKFPVKFTYLNFDSLQAFWKDSIENLESYFIMDFLENYGSYPICNNKSSFPEISSKCFEIDWRFYE